MARPYSARPLTPGVVTIWYRAPEVLLGTEYYTPSVDMWSAGLVLGELLLSSPCLPGETVVQQLSEILKLLGSPSPDDLAALSAMGCPDLIRWRRDGLVAGRADNVERKFLAETSPHTVNVIRSLLQWDPKARWTAAECLGLGKSKFAVEADEWWKERPRAIEKELLPTYPEIRNRTERLIVAGRGKKDADEEQGYVFDFDNRGGVIRPSKRQRAR